MRQSDYIHIPAGFAWQTISGNLKVENRSDQGVWILILAKEEIDPPIKKGERGNNEKGTQIPLQNNDQIQEP